MTIARQHGKTSFILEIFILRKLCESVFDYLEGFDKPICYISASDGNANRMLTNIRSYLLTNEGILDWYGDLVDTDFVEGKKVKTGRNTMQELRLKTICDRMLYSMFSTTPKSGIRGNNFYYVIVDDGVDYSVSKDKRLKVRNIVQETEKFLYWLNNSVAPLCKGFLYIVGTRYGQVDLYTRLYDKHIYSLVNYPAILGPIPSYTLPELKYDAENKLIPATAKDIEIDFEAELLAPELWATKTIEPIPPSYSGTPTQNIIFKIHQTTMKTFLQEYQNDPRNIDSDIKWSDFISCDEKIVLDNINDYRFLIFLDPASGKSTDSDITSMGILAKHKKLPQYYILDIDKGKLDGKEKKRRLSDFKYKWYSKLDIHSTKLPVYVEVVINRDFWNRLVNEPPLENRPLKPIFEENPNKRGTKEERIRSNIVDDLTKGNVFITVQCRNKDQLNSEVDGFPDVHPDALDTVDQAIFLLYSKKSSGGFQTW